MIRTLPPDLLEAIRDYFTPSELLMFIEERREIEIDDVIETYENDILDLIEEIKQEIEWNIDEPGDTE